jgi:hypothetical protein
MFISKKHLSRRAVLRASGACVGLPLLDAMVPAGVAFAQVAGPVSPRRIAFVGFPHGAVMSNWSPAAAGRDYEVSEILAPLERHRARLTIVTGLRNKPAESGLAHSIIERTWLSCTAPEKAGAESADAGVTADQLAARHIGQETPMPSLELTTAIGGGTFSFRTPTQPLPMEHNPRTVFYRLFGQGDTEQQRNQIMRETGSILDRITAEAASLQREIGRRDRTRVTDYLDSVREIERRVQMSAEQDLGDLDIPDAPIGVPGNFDAHLKLMFDLMALAFQADLTRVITFRMDKEISMRTFANLSISEAFHPLSHHGKDPAKLQKLTAIQKYHTELFAQFIDRLANAQEADGTVLDNSVVLYGSNMSDSDRHNNDPLPAALLGGGGGSIRGGQHLKYPQDSKFSNLLLTVFEKAKVPIESIGDSDAVLSEV